MLAGQFDDLSGFFFVYFFLSSCTDENASCRVDTAIIQKHLPVLQKYLNSDTERQLQALYALQALIVTLDQPPSKCSHIDFLYC